MEVLGGGHCPYSNAGTGSGGGVAEVPAPIFAPLHVCALHFSNVDNFRPTTNLSPCPLVAQGSHPGYWDPRLHRAPTLTVRLGGHPTLGGCHGRASWHFRGPWVLSGFRQVGMDRNPLVSVIQVDRRRRTLRRWTMLPGPQHAISPTPPSTSMWSELVREKHDSPPTSPRRGSWRRS